MMKRYLAQSVCFLAVVVLSIGASKAALSGGYTIGAGVASATNYLTFSSAVSDMASGVRADGGPVNGPAISAAVTFVVSPGTYNEQISIPAITGASAFNTITFNGVDPLTRIITWTSVTSGDYTIRLNGADFVRIQNLGIANPGATNGFGVQLLLSADNNTISGCRIDLPTTATSSGKVGIIAATTYTTLGLFASGLSLQNNTITGGYVGIAVNGPSGTQATGLNLVGNTITDAYYTGMYISYINQLVGTGNTVSMRVPYVSGYGAQLRYCSQFNFSGNKFTNQGLYGVYMIGTNFNMSTPSNFVNNMIGGGFQTTGTSYGLYLTTNRFLNVHHNSVLCDNLSGTGARALYILGTSNDLDVRNNSFATTVPSATSYAIYVTSSTAITGFDYNNYYTAGSNLGYFQLNCATLTDLQLANLSFNQNCQVGWPNYISNTDLHTWGAPLSNWAVNIGSVTTDFDAQTRPLPPDLIKDVGADEFNVPLVDADIDHLVSPIVPIVGSNSVQVSIQNNGSSSMNGSPLNLQYSTDGGTTWPVSQVFTPTTLGSIGTQETFTFSTPWVMSVAGSYTLCIRINPLLVGDPDVSDQSCFGLCTGMLGTYTLDGAFATSGTNFNSFTDLATALDGCGIAGPVTVNVAPGVYNQTFRLGHINGVSALNTVTIDGGDTSLVTIQANLTTVAQSVITLDSSDFVTIRGIKVNSVGIYGNCIHLTNGANYCVVDSCALIMPANSTTSYHIGVLAAGTTYINYGNHANYLTVSNNVIRGGYYGVRLNGTSTTVYCDGNSVLNNRITGFYYYGIYSYYQSNPQFRANTIMSRTSGTVSTAGYGIYGFHNHGTFRIEDNLIHSTGSYGIYMSNGNTTNSGTGRITNNMVGGNFATTGNAYCMYMTNCKDIDVYHNSFNLGSDNGFAVYVTGTPPTSDSLRFVNNIFAAGGNFGGGGTAMFVSNAGTVQTLNHNLYYTSGSQLAQYGGNSFSSLALWQSGFPALNTNSVQDNPGFISETNLHLVCSPSGDLGTPVGILQDIDKHTRSTSTPDIGADEFTSITVSTSLGPDTAYCGTTIIFADTVAFETFQWGGNQTQPFLTVDSSGTYSVYVIDSNNCRARDTVVIVIDSLPVLPYDNDTVTVCNTTILDALNAGSTYLWSNGSTTQTTTPSVAGNYYVSITTPAGCSLSDTVTVNLNANPTVDLGPDTTFCVGAGALLDAGAGPTGTTYQWSTGSTTQIVVITSPGSYFVTVTSPQGCYSTDSVSMNILTSPALNLGPNHTACGPETLDAGNPGATYAWSTGANSQTITVTAAGTYIVTVTNAFGCATTDAITITMGTVPAVSLGPDVLLCNGQTLTLDAGNPGSTYVWSNGSTSQTLVVSSAGTYIVSVTHPSGCVGEDEIVVTLSTLSVNLGPNTSICDNGTQTLNAANPGMTYLWSNGATTQTITVSQPGTYSVTVTDLLGCSAGDNIILSQVPGVYAAIGAQSTANVLFPVPFTDLSTGSPNQWEWDFGDAQSSTQQNPTHVYAALGLYTVRLIASDGFCRDTTYTTVDVNQFVGMDEGGFAAAVNLYPNPSDGLFHLYLELYRRADITLQVTDISGKVLYGEQVRKTLNYQGDIDLSDVAKGVYILSIQAGENRIFRKLIVQ